MQSLILMMVLMICCGLQFIGQPFEITGVDNQRHKILPNIELAVLSVLIITLWAGLLMFKLNDSGDSDNDTLYKTLTVGTVVANVIFILILVFILVREMIQEKRNERSSFVLKMDRLFGIKQSDPFSRRDSRSFNNPALAADTVNTAQEISIEMTSTKSSTADIASTIENELPDGWKAHKSDEGTFYEELSSGIVQWNKPSKKHHRITSTEMPPDWDKIRSDDHDRNYYVEKSTGKAQWNKPEGST